MKLCEFRPWRVSSPVTILTAMILQVSSMGAVADVTPPSVSETLTPGASIMVHKVVTTPEIPPKPDIVFLADTTGSMTDAIINVQTNANAIMAAVAGATTDPQFAAAQYRDIGDSPLFNVDQGLTSDQTAVNTAIGTWAAGGGGNTPEDQLHALSELATGAVTYRPGSSRIIVWFGDASGHDPASGGETLASTIAGLTGADARVIAIDVNTGFGDGLDFTGQATSIATATSGTFFPGALPGEVSDAILAGLHLLPITVKPVPVGCGPLNITFDADEKTVTSGDDVEFDETIVVPANSLLAGQTVNCTVEFQANGETIGTQDISIEIPLAIDVTPDTATNELSEDQDHTVTAKVMSDGSALEDLTVNFNILSGPNAGITGIGTSPTDATGQADFSYTNPNIDPSGLGQDSIQGCVVREDGGSDECDTVTKDWVDAKPPVTLCEATVNPHGKKEPQAPGTGQNEDGFYELSATDNIWPWDQLLTSITMTDTGSGTVFGPLLDRNGDGKILIKYTQDSDATPVMKKIGGNGSNSKATSVDWHIIGTGDGLATATDGSGNDSTASCLVPKPPK